MIGDLPLSVITPLEYRAVLDAAIASAKSVVASDIPVVRDIVQNRRMCLLVPPKDPERLAEALIEILQDRDFAPLASQNGPKIEDVFTWDHCAHEIEASYHELI